MTARREHPESDIYSSIAMLWWFIQIISIAVYVAWKYIFFQVRKMLDIQQIFTLWITAI